MTKSATVLEETLKCLRWHCHPEWGDRTPMDVFNRLLAKSIGPPGWTYNTHLDIREDQIESRQEEWSTEKLASLDCAHDEPGKGDFDAPIVLAEYDGVLRVLDGNHRINRWIATKDTHLHKVNVHTVSGTGEFIEVPARR